MSPADADVLGTDCSRLVEVVKRLIGRLFGEGAEGGPFAPDQRVDGVGALAAGRQGPDAVVAADLSGRAAFAIGQWTHAGEAEDNLRLIDADAREDFAHHGQQVIDLGVSDASLIGIVDADIGGADHDAIEEGQDQHDAAIVVFEEDLAVARCRQQLRLIEDEVRAFCPADEALPASANIFIDEVDPGTGGIDDHSWLDPIFRAAEFIAQDDALTVAGDGADVVQSLATAVCGFRVQRHFQANALWRRHPGIVVASGADDGRVQSRVFAQGGFTQAEFMLGHGALLADKEVVEGQADFDDEGAALARPVEQVEELQRRV